MTATRETKIREIGYIRSEMRTAIPRLTGNDIEWLAALIITEREAAYSAGREDGLEEAAQAIQRICCDDCPTTPCGEFAAARVRSLSSKEEGSNG